MDAHPYDAPERALEPPDDRATQKRAEAREEAAGILADWAHDHEMEARDGFE